MSPLSHQCSSRTSSSTPTQTDHCRHMVLLSEHIQTRRGLTLGVQTAHFRRLPTWPASRWESIAWITPVTAGTWSFSVSTYSLGAASLSECRPPSSAACHHGHPAGRKALLGLLQTEASRGESLGHPHGCLGTLVRKGSRGHRSCCGYDGGGLEQVIKLALRGRP